MIQLLPVNCVCCKFESCIASLKVLSGACGVGVGCEYAWLTGIVFASAPYGTYGGENVWFNDGDCVKAPNMRDGARLKLAVIRGSTYTVCT